MTAEPKFRIRRASLDDLDAVAPLFDAYRSFYKQPVEAERSKAFLRERQERGESAVFLATVGDDAAGFCQCYPSFSSVGLSHRVRLNDLYVDERFRGLGIGRALTERAIEHAREQGAPSLELATEITNTTAQRLYESMGFVRKEGYYYYAVRVG
ncbi:MAG: GNAT family N-acetyltransferase [Phycisphaerales bacterium]